MENMFLDVARLAEMVIDAMAIVIVSYGSVDAFIRLARIAVTPGASHGARKAIWQRFGVWLLLGLEFELAADIIATVISPTWQEIGELGAIAAIRTLLNYFLEKDVERAREDLGDEDARAAGGAASSQREER
jgi:uncharacterized membrane protein